MHLPGNCGFSRLAATRQDQVTSATVTFMVSRLRGFEVCRSWWLYTVPLSKGWGRLSAAARSASGGERGKSYTQQLSWCHPVTRRQTGLISIYNSRLVICSSGSRPVSHQCSRFGAGTSSFLNVPTAVAHLDISRQILVQIENQRHALSSFVWTRFGHRISNMLGTFTCANKAVEILAFPLLHFPLSFILPTNL